MKKIFIILLSLFYLGCFSEKKELLIGIDNYESSNMLYMAQEMGYLDNNFKIIRFSTRDDNTTSFYMENLDIIYSTLFNSMYYYTSKNKSKIFYFTLLAYPEDGLIVKEKNMNLTGKKIGIEINNREYYNGIQKLISKNDFKDVELVSVMETEGLNLYNNGKIDGIFVHKNEMDELLKENKGFLYKNKTIESTKIEVFIASKYVLKTRKKHLKHLILAWNKVLEFKNQNPKVFKEIYHKIEKKYGDFESIPKNHNFLTFEENFNFIKSQNFQKAFFNHEEDLKKQIPIKDLYTEEVLK